MLGLSVQKELYRLSEATVFQTYWMTGHLLKGFCSLEMLFSYILSHNVEPHQKEKEKHLVLLRGSRISKTDFPA
jgi:hypothetical protein